MKGLQLFALFGAFVLVVSAVFFVSQNSHLVSALNPTQQQVVDLLQGTNHTVNVLYMGNSRVARPMGFAFDGIEEIAYEQGRLTGNGFVVPVYNYAGDTNADDRILYNKGFGMTTASANWLASDSNSIKHDLGFKGLALTAGRAVEMSAFSKTSLLVKTDPLDLSVQFLFGPDQGTFSVTPVEVQSNNGVIYKNYTPIVINAYAGQYGVGSQHITIPALSNPSWSRSFVLKQVAGSTTVYRVNLDRDVATGISVSEMAFGGHGYERQSNPSDVDGLPASSWTSYVSAYNPDIVFWQFAYNNPVTVDKIINGTKVLMDRVYSTNPNALNIILVDTPTPRANAWDIVNKSRQWAAAMDGYHGAIVIDPNPYLPADYVNYAGTCAVSCQYGPYFYTADPTGVHEARFGSRTVANAIWAALQDYAK